MKKEIARLIRYLAESYVFSQPHSAQWENELKLLIEKGDKKTLKILEKYAFTKPHSAQWTEARKLLDKKLPKKLIYSTSNLDEVHKKVESILNTGVSSDDIIVVLNSTINRDKPEVKSLLNFLSQKRIDVGYKDFTTDFDESLTKVSNLDQSINTVLSPTSHSSHSSSGTCSDLQPHLKSHLNTHTTTDSATQPDTQSDTQSTCPAVQIFQFEGGNP